MVDWAKANPERARAYARKRSQLPHVKEAVKARKPRYKDKPYNHSVRKYSIKRKAHSILAYAVRIGFLVRPDRCQNCQKPCKPEGHHHDYNLPLDVTWLCSSCHGEETRLQNEATRQVQNAKANRSQRV
jgi:hypothetical protein